MRDVLLLLINAFYILLLARVIISWVSSPWSRNPLVRLVYDLTEPVLAPLRQILPPMGGLDLSPLILFLILGVIARML